MGDVLALAAALAYGVSHFLGGLVSRRGGVASVAALSQVAGLILVFCAAPFIPGKMLSIPGLAWGALSAVGTGSAVIFLYHGFSVGRMSVVSPLSEVAAVVLPVLVGFALGQLPTAIALAGVIAAVPAIWLVSRGADTDASEGPLRTRGALSGVLAGAGFALQFIGLAQVPAGTGLWPLAANRVVSVAITGTWAMILTRGSPRLPGGGFVLTLAAGITGTAGSLLYMLATRYQLLALAVVFASLYPVIPVLLGRFMLGERIVLVQKIGLGLAAVAVVLIALG